MKKTALLIWLLFFSISLTAQEDIRDIVEEVVDNLNDRFEEGTDFTEITDRLYDLANRKVNVNSAKQDDLSKIPFLSSYQINQLIQHRKRYGKFETIYEMDAIEGFDRELLRLLEPFISFKEEESAFADGGPLYLNHDIFYRTSSVLQEQKGYLPDSSATRYLGDKASQYMRYIIDSELGEVGMTADKDPGEPFFEGHNTEGFDFYSAHLYYENDGLLNKVALGDYSLQYGQGLNMWTGFTMGKSTSVSGAKKVANGIRPYRSATEGGFFRGAAAGLSRNGFSADVFFSSQNLDGNRVFNADSSDYSVSSIDIGGYHRTQNETEDENSFKEIMYGAAARYRSGGIHFGVTAWRAEYNHAIVLQDRLYNRFRFSGDETWIKGADFSWVMKNVEWFAEASLDTENDVAWLAGANFYLHPRLTSYLFYRDYDKKYNNLYASAAGEYSNSINENGLLYGIRFDIHENWYLNSYIDFFSSEWLNYRSETPSSGKEIEARLSYIPKQDHSAYLKFFYEEKVYNSPSEETIQRTSLRERMKLRIHFSKKLGDVTLKSRAEKSWTSLGEETSEGFLIYQDAVLSIGEAPFRIYGRYAFFETDDYASRLYAYENDVLYAFSFPAYYYKGNRYYLMINYKWNRMDFWLRFASTKYRNRDVILSGLNEINGNRVSKIKFQVRLRF